MEIRLAVNQEQQHNSSGVCTSGRLTYLVTGATNEGVAAAMELARITAPENLGAARREGVELLECPGGGIYKIAVRYENRRSRANCRAGDKEWSFSVHGNTVHTTEAVALIKSVPGETLTTPHPGILVGWNGKNGLDSQVAGINTMGMEMRERCVATYLPSAITANFKKNIMELTGKVNSGSFHGWNGGEVLFLGATQGGEFENNQGTTLVNVFYDFAIKLNSDNYQINDQSLGAVKGWHHVWSITSPDPRRHKLTIAGIYVSQIYKEASFNTLGL